MTKHPEIQLLQITVTLITNLQLDSALLGGIWDLGLSEGRSLTSSSWCWPLAMPVGGTSAAAVASLASPRHGSSRPRMTTRETARWKHCRGSWLTSPQMCAASLLQHCTGWKRLRKPAEIRQLVWQEECRRTRRHVPNHRDSPRCWPHLPPPWPGPRRFCTQVSLTTSDRCPPPWASALATALLAWRPRPLGHLFQVVT